MDPTGDLVAMSSTPELPENFDGTVRLFPLPNVVFFPHVVLPLHIFEPRYRQMTSDALAGDRLIAMVLLRPGWEADYQGMPALHDVACLGTIAADERLQDGRFNILLRGLYRVRIRQELATDRLYRRARVAVLREGEPTSLADAPPLRRKLRRLAASWLRQLRIDADELLKVADTDLPVGTLADLFGFTLPLPVEFKQELLAERDGKLRQGKLIAYLEQSAPPTASTGEPRGFPPSFSAN